MATIQEPWVTTNQGPKGHNSGAHWGHHNPGALRGHHNLGATLYYGRQEGGRRERLNGVGRDVRVA